MDGRARAPAAGTVLNALATRKGAAFAIDLETTATVSLTDDGRVEGEIADRPDADAALIERCVELAVDRYAADAGFDATGARVRTESEVPMASGLKSSSAAANAATLATLDALGVADSVDRIDACRLGVEAARATGVTVTGAFDDASASMLGGVTVTDNATDELLVREEVDWQALVYTPPERAFSADANVASCERVAPMADLVYELALEKRYGEAMTVNGLAFSAALEAPTGPTIEALPHADGVSLSGTGPSYVAVGDRTALEEVRETWAERPGTTRLLETRNDGTRIQT
ncbi:shikimate kinase [Saliphagus sp. LR7]|uniref:shikimate kinase n=1 Tax=Saliphagus sp. LR7 TaxID=2282654 RepID=UPI000DF7594A|nr:shikimate kinase [Saliphagus sp. LR7]